MSSFFPIGLRSIWWKETPPHASHSHVKSLVLEPLLTPSLSWMTLTHLKNTGLIFFRMTTNLVLLNVSSWLNSHFSVLTGIPQKCGALSSFNQEELLMMWFPHCKIPVSFVKNKSFQNKYSQTNYCQRIFNFILFRVFFSECIFVIMV